MEKSTAGPERVQQMGRHSFTCPRCSKGLEVPTKCLGSVVQCCHCRQLIQVPGQPGSSGAADAVTHRTSIKTGADKRETLSLPKESVQGFTMCLVNPSARPRDSRACVLDMFEQYNPKAFEVLRKYNPSNLRIEFFISQGSASPEAAFRQAVEHAQSQYPSSVCVVQYGTVAGPNIGKCRAVLCTFFKSQRPSLVLMEENSPFELE